MMRTHQQGKAEAGKLRVRIFSIIVVLIMLLGAVITLTTRAPAKADTGGYPYASMPCVWAPYATTGTGNWCKKVNASGQIVSDYDWGTIHDNNSSSSEQSPYGYDYRNCTDYVAWVLAVLGVPPALYQGLGNAKDWPVNAPGKGLKVNTTPALGAAAVSTAGAFGHVAFISAYNASTGVITVQEYNKKQDGNYGTRSGTLSGLGFSNVVHFEKHETSDHLNGIAAVSATDIWAVGGSTNNLIGGSQTLTEHWNGSSWKMVSGSSSVLSGVAAVSATDVWAVGTNYAGDTLTEHWNGSSWSVIPSPNLGSSSILSGVAAVSATDVWAVGYYADSSGSSQPLIEHWNGSSWSVIPSPNLSSSCSYDCNTLSSVAAVSATDVWAVGFYGASTGYTRTLVEHWNGSKWKVVASPNSSPYSNSLNSVAAVSATDVWAVGYYSPSKGGPRTLTEHWNGSSWSVIPSSNPGSGNVLSSVAAVSATDVWAVGYSGYGYALIEHWNGSSWQAVPSPNPSLLGYSLYGVAVISATNVWAVGYNGGDTLTEHWNGSSWKVVPSPNP